MINSFSGRWAFLSNFYLCKITHQGIVYPSSEHYYVAMKVKEDQLINGKMCPASDVREMISKISTPGQVKRFGRSLSIRKDWDSVKLKAMEWVIREKFTKHPDLKEMLIQTGNEEIIESNYWHDIFWGVCTCEKCGNKGENHLGKLIMKIRDEIRNQNRNISLEDVLFLKK
jgi:ribA/ribD-fused uncharacterized protein